MSDNLADINKEKYSKDGAFEYQNDKWHKIRIEKSLEIIKNYKKEKHGTLKALDIGCGDGGIAERIQNLGINMYGIDVSHEQLKNAEKRGVHTQEGDIQKTLPYNDNSFDIVFAGEVIEHIADPRNFVTEINRILKTGGLFVVTTPNLAGFDNRIRLLFGKIPRCIEPLSSHHYQHVRPFTFSSLEDFLNKGGFAVDSFASNRVKVLSFDFLKIDSYVLAEYLPSIGATLIVGAIKNSDVGGIELNKS